MSDPFPQSRYRPKPHPPDQGRLPTGYQPFWQDGHEVGIGLRECNSRYQAIKGYLYEHAFTAGFTVLDLGAFTGYFCRRLNEDFGARCTAVDNNPGLVESPGVKVIHRLLNPARIRELEHFDVALCLSVLHHHGDWADYITALQDRADLCFFETANPNEHVGWHRAYVEGSHNALSRMGTMIAQTPPMAGGNNLRPLWVIDQRRSRGT